MMPEKKKDQRIIVQGYNNVTEEFEEVTGQTQNILVLDDKRDESKPSMPSQPSG